MSSCGESIDGAAAQAPIPFRETYGGCGDRKKHDDMTIEADRDPDARKAEILKEADLCFCKLHVAHMSLLADTCDGEVPAAQATIRRNERSTQRSGSWK